MLSPAEAQGLFAQALAEFAPEWESLVPVAEITARDPNNWLSGMGTFGATLRQRTTGAIKVLGRRHGGAAGASYHRGISRLVLQAYAERNTDPICRYLEELGITIPPTTAARRFTAPRAG